MLKRMAILSFMILSVVCSAAPPKAPGLGARALGYLFSLVPAPTAPAYGRYHPILFRVTRPGAEIGCSYLLGTMHGGIWDIEIPNEVWDALESSDTLAVESAPPADFAPQLRRTLPQQSWAQELTAKERAKLVQLREAAGDPEPESIFTEDLAIVVFASYRTFTPAPPRPLPAPEAAEEEWARLASLSLDLSLIGRARSDGKTVIGLDQKEGADLISSAMGMDTGDKQSQKTLLQSLKATLRLSHWAVFQASVIGVIFRSGNLAQLEPQFRYQSQHMRNALIRDRSLAWVPILKEQLSQRPTFTAVGALHLIGDTGLVELLRAEGFVLERVPTTPKPLPF